MDENEVVPVRLQAPFPRDQAGVLPGEGDHFSSETVCPFHGDGQPDLPPGGRGRRAGQSEAGGEEERPRQGPPEAPEETFSRPFPYHLETAVILQRFPLLDKRFAEA
jgi:hypothetical protein